MRCGELLYTGRTLPAASDDIPVGIDFTILESCGNFVERAVLDLTIVLQNDVVADVVFNRKFVNSVMRYVTAENTSGATMQ